jgi:H+-transporting ATPase
LLMVLAILVFNFYPVTAVMIVMIAVLNDGAILSIAYDNVLYKNKPEAWNMRLVLGISSVLGVIGVAAAFGLFFFGDRYLHLSHPQLQTLMYLKLSVAGHLTIFLTRTRGPFWSIRPAKILWIAVLGTQTVATLIAVYGLFMTPLGWKLAGLVWAYALVCFLLTDRVKLLGYKLLDHVDADAPKPEVKADAPKQEAKATEAKPDDKDGQAKPDAKVQEPKPEIKAETKPEATAEPKTEARADLQPESKAKTPSDLHPQIARLAYELYEERGRGESPAVLDWKQAEREIKKNGATSDPKAQPKVEPVNGLKPDTSHEVKAESNLKTNAADPQPDGKDESSPEANVPSDLTPQIVKRVHQLYEQLGRADLRAVEALEKTERDNRNDDTKADPNPEAKVEPAARG